MGFNIKDFVSGLGVKIKSTTDGSNGEVPHHNVDSSALPDGAATAALQGTGNTSLSSIDTKMTALAGYVDGLEALATTLNGYVDGLETFGAAHSTKLDTLHTDIATTLAGLITTLNGYVDGLEALAAAPTAISQVTPGTSDHVTGSGFFASVGGTLALRASATAYTSGKIIAQSATAGSCSGIAIAAARANDKTGMVRKLRLKINSATWLNAIVRVHLFKDAPTFTNADAGNFAAGVSESNYLGYADVTLDQSFADPFVKGTAIPTVGGEWNFEPSSGTQNIFAALEARSTVTADASSKTFSLVAEVLQN